MHYIFFPQENYASGIGLWGQVVKWDVDRRGIYVDKMLIVDKKMLIIQTS